MRTAFSQNLENTKEVTTFIYLIRRFTFSYVYRKNEGCDFFTHKPKNAHVKRSFFPRTFKVVKIYIGDVLARDSQ